MRRPAAVLVTGLALCLVVPGLLTGCFPVSDPVPESTFPAEPLQRSPKTPMTDDTVLAYCPDLAAEHFEGFTEYEVVYDCRADDHRPSDGTTTYGPWQSAYRITDPRPLLEMYAEPNETRVVTGQCPGGVPDPLILWVHAAGDIQAIYAPVDGCGFPREDIVAAYQVAHRELVAEVDSGGPLDAHDTPAEH